MQRAKFLATEKDESVTLVTHTCNPAETKWIISRMAFFVGLRTHSTIVPLESCMPASSFGYSIKAHETSSIERDLTEYHNSPERSAEHRNGTYAATWIKLG